MIDLSGLAQANLFSFCASQAITRLDWRAWGDEIAIYQKSLHSCAICCERCGAEMISVPAFRCSRFTKCSKLRKKPPDLKVKEILSTYV